MTLCAFPLHGTALLNSPRPILVFGQRQSSLAWHMTSCTKPQFLNSQAAFNSNTFFNNLIQIFIFIFLNGSPQNYAVKMMMNDVQTSICLGADERIQQVSCWRWCHRGFKWQHYGDQLRFTPTLRGNFLQWKTKGLVAEVSGVEKSRTMQLKLLHYRIWHSPTQNNPLFDQPITVDIMTKLIHGRHTNSVTIWLLSEF